MAKNFSKVLLMTANVGSIFEEPDKMLPIWLREFLATITKLEPEFLAIHCQEVGGKNYEDTMQHVNKFIKMLLASEEMQQFDRARVFLDEDFTAVEKFTALGSLYFIHHSVKTIEIFDFHEKKFVPVEGKEVLSGNIEHVHIKEKAKFAQEFFPDFIWSRKGFIRTRWNLNHTYFDLVNIHLFHDISNIAAMETSPSTYSSHRERALLHTVERFETDEYDKVPFFIFGDYNFRMDTNVLVKHLTVQAEEERVLGKKKDVSAVIFKEKENGKLQVYDTEPQAIRDKLFEYEVTFPPSFVVSHYKFIEISSENMEDGTSYMPTRCPGWCDRIMMSHAARNLLYQENISSPEYKMIGAQICMGDHKPIYLNLKIRQRAGINSQGDVEHAVDEADVVYPLKSPLKHVISINGEEVEASSMENINIHDYMTFEQEELVTSKFKGLIKRRHAGPTGLKSGWSFRNVVHNVLRTENIVKAMKRFKHRSDSESDTEDEEKLPLHQQCPNSAAAGPTHADAAAAANCDDPGKPEDEVNTNANNSNFDGGEETEQVPTTFASGHEELVKGTPDNGVRVSADGSAINESRQSPDGAVPESKQSPDGLCCCRLQ